MRMERRMRRLRATEAVRGLVRETRLGVEDFVYPVFVKEGAEEEVRAMPGVRRWGVEGLLRHVEEAMGYGLRAVAMFPCIEPSCKDAEGSFAYSDKNVLFRALRELRRRFPEVVLVADVALDPYTSHGHDGVMTADGGDVDNDRTVEALCKLAVLEAEAGATWVAPSDMMDGRIREIRRALDEAGFEGVGVLSYAAKFASAYYGPFREAVGSRIGGCAVSKATYQLDPANLRQALLEVELDVEEGADLVMIKPAGPYLDVIRCVAERCLVPVCAYQVSGEYAQIYAAAREGWLPLQAARDEALLAIKRAGADIIFSYFAFDWAKERCSLKR